ncbi:hypothetical protein KDH_31850 [Dictyobacter sp. S3.2.2.5]|uniref:DUF4177 domain-containing protein n=1 Tax=Dictyobacter halimunensis TaxID=3026934 RepID=A0ABQ6FPZ5_9CHLR|nr:hypothetical protein KDH_31850 [Dictyobacter sp. S3.2.2.5]
MGKLDPNVIKITPPTEQIVKIYKVSAFKQAPAGDFEIDLREMEKSGWRLVSVTTIGPTMGALASPPAVTAIYQR